MYSQCPECHARFRVTAAALKAANGTVRCGRCGGAFNALATLSDTVPEPTAGGVDTHVAALHAAVADAPPATDLRYPAGDIEQVFLESGGWISDVATDATGPEAAGSDLPAYGAEPPIVVVSESAPFEDITLEGERISIESLGDVEIDFDAEELGRDLDSTDEFEVIDNVPDSAWPEDADETGSGKDAGTAPEPERVQPGLETLLEAPSTHATPPRERAPAIEEPVAMRADAPSDLRWRSSRADAGEPAAAPHSGHVLAWSLGCLVLVLALLAQLTHQFRQDLVRHPQVGPVLRDAYDRLGLPLSPNWDVGAFELRQWGNDDLPGASGRLTVRANLTNRASFAQPHPLLRLEFDDRYGEAVASRDFKPAEYLRSAADARRLIAPGASAEIELVILDPGRDAVGYQLDVCLPESATVLRCARGPG